MFLVYPSLCTCIFLTILTLGYAEKYRLCIVDGKGRFKKSQKYCSKLEQPDSKVQCVIAVDRLDCLRRISKGSADFSVFTAEDLVTAENVGIETILLTNELRFTNDSYEYKVATVIDNNSGIKSRHDLKGTKYCHPGYGYESDWTSILSNFFETSVTTPSCDEKLTLIENRIKATGDFFKSACKAGAWINNAELDFTLKKKYQHLCDLCGNPSSCSKNDKYWGRKGSLLCLTDGVGDVGWARLDDIQQHFGLSEEDGESDPDGYSLLCPDDTLIPVNTTTPCIWVEKPWPVVGSRRAVAQDIQEVVSSLGDDTPGTWKYILRYLLDNTYAEFVRIEPMKPIETYLYKPKGYLSANSFSGCHPPRTIWICTTSIKEAAKCHWLRESAAVYGLEPNLDCINADNLHNCMKAVSVEAADIVLLPPDLVYEAISKFNLTSLFYETVKDTDKYLTVAVAKSDVDINSWEDIRGKNACFPIYGGVAWNTVKYHLTNRSLIRYCPTERGMTDFFGSSCTPKLPKDLPLHMTKLCQGEAYNGDHSALDCLTSGMGEIAFVSKNSIMSYVKANITGTSGRYLTVDDFKVICLTPTETCHLSWDTVGRGMVRNNVTELWKKDTVEVFMFLSDLFGKNYKSTTIPFTLFGKYDDTSNLLFHDVTRNLRKVPTDRDTDQMPYHYEKFLDADTICVESNCSIPSLHITAILAVTALFSEKYFRIFE